MPDPFLTSTSAEATIESFPRPLPSLPYAEADRPLTTKEFVLFAFAVAAAAAAGAGLMLLILSAFD